jgi:hypothetical protein
MAQATNTSNAGDGLKPEDRYRYIGFQVFPSKSDTFWKSDSEAQQYAAKVKAGLGESVLHREFSLLETETMSKADKWVLTLAGAVMVLSVALPWVAFRTTDATNYSLSWPSALGTLLGGIGTAFSSGIGVGLSALLGLVVMLGAPLLGLWTLAMVWRKAKSAEAYFEGLRLPLKLSYVIFFSGLGVMFLAFFGGSIPGFASWGLIDPPEHYGISALFRILSFGPYVALGMSLVCAVKSGDL